MLKSSNPAWKAFEQPQRWDDAFGSPAAAAKPTTMTVGGTAQAAGIQLGCAFVGAMGGWYLVAEGILAGGLSMGVSLGIFAMLFIGGMIMARKPQIAIVVGPILSALYGFFAGVMSYVVALAVGAAMAKNPQLLGVDPASLTADQLRAAVVSAGAGVVFQAILLTIAVAGITLVASATGLIRIGNTAAKVIMFATGAVMLVYVLGMVLRLVGFGGIPLIHEAGPVGIAFSGFVVLLAAFNLIMSYQNVREGVAAGLPKFMEWYAGYAIVSTIIWLYIEILWLLYKLYVMFNRE